MPFPDRWPQWQRLTTRTGKHQAASSFNTTKPQTICCRHLDTSHIKAYASYLARIGVQGVYIIGTTGEGYSLSLAEKLSLVEAWRTALDALPADRRLVAVVNVSSTVVTEAVTLAARVEELGFDGVALLPPIYYVAPSKDHLVEYISDIQSRGAPNTPLLYYHIPSFTGELKCKYQGV